MRPPTWILGTLLCACGGASQEPPATPAEKPAALVAEPARPAATLWRDEVEDTVALGLGSFLQRVEVEASLDNGRFVGFRIVSLQPPEFWQGVDLKPGDVVTRVNGMPIERETEAYDAFQALRTASELRVSLQRAGAPRTLVYRIADRPGRKPSPKPVTPPAKSPPAHP